MKSEQCQICGKYNHSTLQCRQHFNHSCVADDIPQTLAAMKLHKPSDDVWYQDTKVSNHTTANPGILSYFKPYIWHEKILIDNENLLDITQTNETQLNAPSN